MPRVYIDSGVLILASRAQEDDVTERAIAELDREDAVYLYSSIVELETLPQPRLHKYEAQVEFLEAFFADAERVDCTAQVQANALAEASRGQGLAACDALHVACAIAGNADELVCNELPTKQLPKTKAVAVRTIR